MAVGSDMRIVRGILCPNDKDSRLRGIQLSDTLKLSLANHDTQRPSTKEWIKGQYNHTIRSQ